MGNAVTKTDGQQAITTVEPVTPMQMISHAVQQGHDLEKIRELMQLEREWKADRAREAFYEALSEFKKQSIQVTKDKKNTQYGSYYTTIGNLVNTVNAAMAPFGLNARWNIEQDDRIRVTCILSHTLGHSEEVSMSGMPDDSGKKNPLQQIKSTITYLESATFQAVTGVVSQEGNLDDDGNGAGAAASLITAGQAKAIGDLIEETNTDKATFLSWACEGATELDQIPAAKFNECMQMLNRKKQAPPKKKPETVED